VLSRNPRLVEWLHSVPARPMSPLALLSSLRWCDAVAVVGGGMFGYGMPPLVGLLPAVVWAAGASGRDYTYLAIGAYPGMPRAVKWLLRRSTRAPGRISVRDALSAQTLGPQVAPPCVGDLAFGLRAAPAEQAWRALSAAGVDRTQRLLLLSLKALPDKEKQRMLFAACATAAQRWRAAGGEVAVLALSTHADYGIGLAERDTVLAGRLGEELGEPLPVLGPQLPPALAKAIVGQADAVLGLRLHALIFAVSTGVECRGFDWEEKTSAFLSDNNLPALHDTLDVHGWLDDLLTAKVDAR